MKRLLEEIKQETVDFVDEFSDEELNQRLADAIIPVITNSETGTGNTKKAIVSLAWFTSKFLKMCSMKTEGEPVSTEEYGTMFYEILDLFCFIEDHPEDENKD